MLFVSYFYLRIRLSTVEDTIYTTFLTSVTHTASKEFIKEALTKKKTKY